MRRYDRRSSLMATLVAAGIAWLAPSIAQGEVHGRGLCATAAAGPPPPYLAVVSAYPAELAPIVAATEIETTVQIASRSYYVGRLGGVSVMLGLTGIGIVNATNAARDLLATAKIAGLIMSGTAGTRHHIGDVVLASDLVESDRKGVFHPNRALVALVRRAAIALPEPLERCSPVPPESPDSPIVCLLFDPTVIFGGHAVSGDTFGGPFPCTPGGGEIFGCELPAPTLSGVNAGTIEPTQTISTQDVEDMESAAVARAAARRGVPFLAVRAASDGGGDPRGDRGFPTQFFDYYRLAAHNAGDVTRAVVAELGRLARDASLHRTCRLLAEHRWGGAAKRIAAMPGG
jgi:adenosylhomocysteine nucleosidase